MSTQEHWESLYASKGDRELSWTQPEPRTSLLLIGEVCPAGRVIDVGGGTSLVAERLLDRGYSITVLDISRTAIDRARNRGAARTRQIHWIVADVTAHPDLDSFDVWHDRAVFHFLIAPADRAAYTALLAQTVPMGGRAVVGKFALDGPEKCSGLEVQRYDGQKLAVERAGNPSDSEGRAAVISVRPIQARLTAALRHTKAEYIGASLLAADHTVR